MTAENKSYGHEGGYEDWTADKVLKNMRIMSDGKQVADVEVTEDIGEVNENEDYSDTDDIREE